MLWTILAMLVLLWLITTRRDGGKSVRYKVYMVRKWAYVVLRELGVDIPTVYEEEIKQP
jgi:hypothetical protein